MTLMAATLSTQVLIAALGAGGLSAIVAAIVTGLFSKRKLGAEATEIITKAAASVVTNLNEEIVRITTAMSNMKADYESRISVMEAAHRTEWEEARQVIQLHVAWDVLTTVKLGEHGIELPPAPPLLPPHHKRGG